MRRNRFGEGALFSLSLTVHRTVNQYQLLVMTWGKDADNNMADCSFGRVQDEPWPTFACLCSCACSRPCFTSIWVTNRVLQQQMQLSSISDFQNQHWKRIYRLGGHQPLLAVYGHVSLRWTTLLGNAQPRAMDSKVSANRVNEKIME